MNRVMSDDGASQQQGARKMDFSTRMGPDELAQWLLATYGQAYQSDIDKFKSKCDPRTVQATMLHNDFLMRTNITLPGALINGELFLELPGDDELLKELQLSIGFKRLVVKKAKEVRTCMQEKKLAQTINFFVPCYKAEAGQWTYSNQQWSRQW